jgi:arylsulfatase A
MRFAIIGFLGVALSGVLTAAVAGSLKPNVLLILADDLGYEGLSCNGSLSYQTPHLDRLAEEGARFTQCYSQPLCTPTRVQIMTGRYYFRNYVRFGTLAQGERTFAHMAKEAGYATAVAGKWQLGAGGDSGQSPAQAGFDEYCLWNLNLDEMEALGNRYADPNLIYLDPQRGQPQFKSFQGGYGPDVCVDYLCDFMERSVGEGRPFLAYYPMLLPHGPFKPTPNSPAWADKKHDKNPGYYKDMVQYMDGLVKRLETKLNQLETRTNTLLIFVGDNGTPNPVTSTMPGGLRVQGGKGFANDRGTHVPLVVNWPGTINSAQVRSELVDLSDFLPTLAQVMQSTPLVPPGDGVLDGRSFLPLLLGQTYQPREWVFIDYTEPRQNQFGWPRARFVRNERYKLYGFYERQPKGKGKRFIKRTGQFFDLLHDPEEQKPLDVSDLNTKTELVWKSFRGVLDGFPPVRE